MHQAAASNSAGPRCRKVPLYFFNIRNGSGFVPDEEGRDLSGEHQALKEALKGARSLLSAEVLEGRLDLRGRIEVTDESKRLIAEVRFRDAVRVEDGELPPAEETTAG